MKAIFGVVSLLVALAIVGLLATKQLRAVGRAGEAPRAEAGLPAAPALSGSGTVREQSQQIQKQIEGDVKKALEQGAAGRAEQADK